MNIAIFITSRNNYDMMGEWYEHIKGCNVPILNIDEDSEPEQKLKGRKLCKNFGIEYADCDVRGMQNNASFACRYFNDPSIKYLIWFQHDCWPIHISFFRNFSDIVNSGSLDRFGSIGFNAVATDVMCNCDTILDDVRRGRHPICVIGRSCLTDYIWWSGCKLLNHTPMLPRCNKYILPSAVESVAWFAIAINKQMFSNVVRPSSDYQFFHAWDDVCFQFLNNNIYNIILPNLYIEHRPEIKTKYGIPARSVKLARTGDETYHGKFDHIQVWKKRWGWDWRDKRTFKGVQNRYRKTLIPDFYNHDFSSGPVKVFNDI